MLKKFIYHIRPKNFKGNTIWPLNAMKTSDPDLYEVQSSKYKGREFLMDFEVPVLNCLWNDVVHCTPINPNVVYGVLKELGFVYQDIEYFKIPINVLDGCPVAFYNYPAEDMEDETECFSIFSSDKYKEISEVPNRTLTYYKQCKENNSFPLLFHHVDHILIKAPINLIDSIELEKTKYNN